jgi:hypothetical protein
MKDIISGCTICRQRFFNTVVFTIVAFPAHPPYGWLKVWTLHYPERPGSKNRIDSTLQTAGGILAPMSVMISPSRGCCYWYKRCGVLCLTFRLLELQYNLDLNISAIKINAIFLFLLTDTPAHDTHCSKVSTTCVFFVKLKQKTGVTFSNIPLLMQHYTEMCIGKNFVKPW